jgi:hypothetical protein
MIITQKPSKAPWDPQIWRGFTGHEAFCGGTDDARSFARDCPRLGKAVVTAVSMGQLGSWWLSSSWAAREYARVGL